MRSHRVLPSPMRTFRIGDPHDLFPIFSGRGAARTEGRWHTLGQEVIYTSEHYSTALLEKLVYMNGIMPPNQYFIQIEIPADVTYELVTKDTIPDWASSEGSAARSYGSAWYAEARSAILIVPSCVAREENNVLINSHHPDAKSIKPSLETPIYWDKRLFIE